MLVLEYQEGNVVKVTNTIHPYGTVWGQILVTLHTVILVQQVTGRIVSETLGKGP